MMNTSRMRGPLAIVCKVTWNRTRICRKTGQSQATAPKNQSNKRRRFLKRSMAIAWFSGVLTRSASILQCISFPHGKASCHIQAPPPTGLSSVQSDPGKYRDLLCLSRIRRSKRGSTIHQGWVLRVSGLWDFGQWLFESQMPAVQAWTPGGI